VWRGLGLVRVGRSLVSAFLNTGDPDGPDTVRGVEGFSRVRAANRPKH
jgi:hypothetical protein